MNNVNTKRKRHDPARAAAVKRTAEVFGVDPAHVRMIDNGVRNNPEILKFYRELYKSLREALAATPAGMK